MGKRKKKGRPSLLDLQKRSLRLQNPIPSSKPNPNPNRRITRRNPNPDVHVSSSDEETENKKKKLKLVNRIPNSANSEPESDKEEANNLKVTTAQGVLPDSGPTTPLPNEKLLVFILDGLQKKDTYGVFSDPVDPKELPDYHEIIEHPMDFGTVKKKLSNGSYATLEQFEKDVLLICSNAMCYNSQDTIYYRQARAIQELAKRNFENLRQESDDNEAEPKTVVRRGRPPSKNIKPQVVRASVDRAASDFSSDATLANAGEGVHWSNLTNDLSRKGSASKRAGAGDVVAGATYNLRNTEPYRWTGMHKLETNEDYPGNALKGISTKYGKKLPVADENRRSTYYQPQSSTTGRESSILTTFDSEKKHLIPQIGLRLEHAYARSLARFAAKLGPIGWAITAKKIERILPPGTSYGRGWIGENEAPRHAQLSISSPYPPKTSSQPNVPLCTTIAQSRRLLDRLESSTADLATEEGHSIRTPPPISAPIVPSRSSTSIEVASEPVGRLSHGASNPPSGVCGGNSNSQFNSSSQFHQNAGSPPIANGETTALGFNSPSHAQPMGPLGADVPVTHARALDMVPRSGVHRMPRSHSEAEMEKLLSTSGAISSGNVLPDQSLGKDSQGSWRSLSLLPKQGTFPPDLNVRFQSSGPPAPGVMVDSQHPDLALQL